MYVKFLLNQFRGYGVHSPRNLQIMVLRLRFLLGLQARNNNDDDNDGGDGGGSFCDEERKWETVEELRG